MAGFVMHVGASVICTHGAPVSVSATQGRVRVSGQLVATASDTFMVSGCPFNVGGSPQPCVQVRWIKPASRVFVEGKPVVLQTSSGTCVAGTQAVQGTPQVIATQTRVKGM